MASMDDDPIIRQIDNIGERRFAGCLGRLVLALAASLLALALVVRYTPGRSLRVAVASVSAGWVIGMAASRLAPQARRFLIREFTILPAVAIVVFGFRALLDLDRLHQFRAVTVPVFVSIGSLIALRAWKRE